jgi:hypothetical protein
MEEWRVIDDTNGDYSVSDLGRVRSNDRVLCIAEKPGRKSHTRKQRGKILSPVRDRQSGHLSVQLGRKRLEGVPQYVHRLVLAAFVGEAPIGAETCHNNGDPSDNLLTNLRWATRGENNRDRTRHGVHLLTYEEAAEIRKICLTTQTTQVETALRYGVRTHTVNDIMRGRSYVQ